MTLSFEKIYPNIARWIDEHGGLIEIGHNEDSPLTSFIRALDSGGMYWQGKDSYPSLDTAFQDLDAGLEAVLMDLYGE